MFEGTKGRVTFASLASEKNDVNSLEQNDLWLAPKGSRESLTKKKGELNLRFLRTLSPKSSKVFFLERKGVLHQTTSNEGDSS